MGAPRARVKKLSDGQVLQLVRLASGLLARFDGDLDLAMSTALKLHFELLEGVRGDGIRADLGKGDAVLFVPDEGGLAIRVERHKPSGLDALGAIGEITEEDAAPTEEADYPPIDLMGFEVRESAGEHRSQPVMDAGVDEETWFE